MSKSILFFGYDPTGVYEEARRKALELAKTIPPDQLIVLEWNTIETLDKLTRKISDFAGTGPANLTMFTHSGDTVFWLSKSNQDIVSVNYQHFFSNLPANISEIALIGCHTEKAVAVATYLKPGVALFPFASESSPIYKHQVEEIANRAMGKISPEGVSARELAFVNLKIFNPESMAETNRDIALTDSYYNENSASTDMYKIIPDTIAIGGNPPRIIDLKNRYASIFSSASNFQHEDLKSFFKYYAQFSVPNPDDPDGSQYAENFSKIFGDIVKDSKNPNDVHISTVPTFMAAVFYHYTENEMPKDQAMQRAIADYKNPDKVHHLDHLTPSAPDNTEGLAVRR